jgi:hypothetical protein
MALWDVTQTTTYMTGTPLRPPQTSNLGVYDDATTVTTDVLLNFFGVSEGSNMQVSSPSASLIVAKIQYSAQTPTPAGWQRDREVAYDYVVEFRAVRRS